MRHFPRFFFKFFSLSPETIGFQTFTKPIHFFRLCGIRIRISCIFATCKNRKRNISPCGGKSSMGMRWEEPLASPPPICRQRTCCQIMVCILLNWNGIQNFTKAYSTSASGLLSKAVNSVWRCTFSTSTAHCMGKV